MVLRLCPTKKSLMGGWANSWAIVAQAKFNKLEGRSQPREAKLSLEIRNNLLIPSSSLTTSQIHTLICQSLAPKHLLARLTRTLSDSGVRQSRQAVSG